MYDGHNFERLKAHILPLSEAADFDLAKTEWKLTRVELYDDWDNCPCGKEIKELCYLENTRNRNTTYVGNVCVKRFIGIDTGNLFDGLKRIAADHGANVNWDVLRYAQERGYLYENEYKFLVSTMHKRKLSQKQYAWKQKINRRILEKIVVQRRT